MQRWGDRGDAATGCSHGRGLVQVGAGEPGKAVSVQPLDEGLEWRRRTGVQQWITLGFQVQSATNWHQCGNSASPGSGKSEIAIGYNFEAMIQISGSIVVAEGAN